MDSVAYMSVIPDTPKAEAGRPLKGRRPAWGGVPSPTKKKEKESGKMSPQLNLGL